MSDNRKVGEFFTLWAIFPGVVAVIAAGLGVLYLIAAVNLWLMVATVIVVFLGGVAASMVWDTDEFSHRAKDLDMIDADKGEQG